MKRSSILNLVLLVTLSAFITPATATKYSAVANGNYTSPSTWENGNVPPANLGADTIYLFSGSGIYTVNLDVSITLGALTEVVMFHGSFTGAGKYISVPNGRITCDYGSIDVDSFYLSGNASMQFEDVQVTLNKLTLSAANYAASLPSLSASTIVKERLHVKDGVCMLGSRVGLSGVTKVPILEFSDNGGLGLNTGGWLSVNLATGFGLKYKNNNTCPAMFNVEEQTITGLVTLEVDAGSGPPIDMLQDIFVTEGIMLTSGILNMNGHDITLTSTAKFDNNGTGTLSASPNANIFVSSVNTDLGNLSFTPGANTLSGLFMAGGGILTLESDLNTTTLSLQGGHVHIKNNLLNATSTSGIAYGSVYSYVMMDAGGRLRSSLANSAGYIHAGTLTSYLPLRFLNGSGSCDLTVTDNVKSGGTTGMTMMGRPLVNATWNLVTGATNLTIEPGWTVGSETSGFDRSKCYVAYHDGTKWDTQPTAAAAGSISNYSIARTGASGGVYAVFDINTLSVTELLQHTDVKVYPNPASATLNIEYNNAIPAMAYVYDISGRMVAGAEVVKGTNSINIASLPAGSYILKVNAGQSSAQYTLVKQ